MPDHRQPRSIRHRPLALAAVALGLAVTVARAAPQAPESRSLPVSDGRLLPEAVASFGAATLGDELFVVGGHVGERHVHSKANVAASVRRVALAAAGEWSTEPGPGLQGLALVAHRNALIRIGGLSPRNEAGEPEDLWSVGEVARRTAASATWESLPDLPAPRSSHDAAVIGDQVVVAGGWTLAGKERVWADVACVLDLAASAPAWKAVSQPFRRRALAVVASRGRVFAIGGIDEEGEPSRRVDVLDLAAGTWSRGPDLPWAAFGAGAYGDDRLLIVSAIDGRIVRLDDDGSSWKTIGALAVPRFFHRIVRAPGGALLFVGGAGRDGHVRLIEPFLPEAEPAARFVRVRVPWPGASKNRQAAILRDGNLILVGGNKSLGQHDFAPENFLDEAWTLDLASLQAAPLPPLPAHRQSLVVAEQPVPAGARQKDDEDERPAAMLGGFGSEAAGAERTFREAFVFTPGRPFAAAGPPLPEPLTQFGVAATAGDVWMFGGLDYDRARGEDGAFRHSDRIWISRAGGPFEDAGARMPSPRRAFGYAFSAGAFYAAGGLEDGFKVVDEFCAFDLASRKWRQLGKPAPRISPELIFHAGDLWLAGGSNRAAKPPFLERYDRGRDAWATVTTEPPFDPVHLRVASWRGRLLFWSTHRKEPVLDLAWLVPPAP